MTKLELQEQWDSGADLASRPIHLLAGLLREAKGIPGPL